MVKLGGGIFGENVGVMAGGEAFLICVAQFSRVEIAVINFISKM